MADFIFTEDDLDQGLSEDLDGDPHAVQTELAPDVEMEGILTLKQGGEFSGLFQGTVHSHSGIRIKKQGCIEGTIDAYNVVIEGRAYLNVIARSRLEICEGGFFVGTLEVQPEEIILSEFSLFGEDEETANEFQQEYTRERSLPPAKTSKA